MDISPLFEAQWSGIARVTAALGRALIERGGDVAFFYRDLVVETAMVDRTLRSGSAAGLRILIDNGFAISANLAECGLTDSSVAIYPNIKTDRKRFGRFCLVVYDLSFVLTPEFHDGSMITGYCRHLWQNAQDASTVLAISEATKRDLVTYFGMAAEKIFVAHLGTDITPLRSETTTRIPAAKPYFLVVGTIEPRKNIELVLEFICTNRQILNNYEFIFIGKDGWGTTWHELVESKELQDPRIRHLGYLADAERDELIDGCEALLFPSFFEGYGLPVLEAMARGKVVLASRSSGIVEAGGEHVMSFDPTNLSSFADTFMRFVRMSQGERETLAQLGRSFAETRTWAAFGAAALMGFGLNDD